MKSDWVPLEFDFKPAEQPGSEHAEDSSTIEWGRQWPKTDLHRCGTKLEIDGQKTLDYQEKDARGVFYPRKQEKKSRVRGGRIKCLPKVHCYCLPESWSSH